MPRAGTFPPASRCIAPNRPSGRATPSSTVTVGLSPLARGSKKEVAIERSKPFGFRVEVDNAEVRVFLDGVPACSWQHGGREVHETLSIEVNDRIVWIEDLFIEPLEKK